MGAALTYARRYALFTLVGIAGEDDLDAPDLDTSRASQDDAGNGRSPADGDAARATRADAAVKPPQRSGTGNGKNRRASPKPFLKPEASAALCTRLLAEIAGLDSPEQATLWARRSLPKKNALTADDAGKVEAAFQAKMIAGERADATATPPATAADPSNAAEEPPTATRPDEASFPGRIDKSSLALAEPRRYRDKAHRDFVAQQACLVCGRKPADPHHLRYMQPRALGRRVSDEFTVPLCRGHHRELHRVSDERQWWCALGIDPLPVAGGLWQQSRGRTTALTAPR
jgi:hypothetical protein